MISRARIHESLFRRSARGREVMAPPGEGGDHVHYVPLKHQGIGVTTSRPRPTCTFWELLAWKLSGEGNPGQALVPHCTVTQAKRLYEEGLIP